MLKIGIECESIEGLESWGVGRIVKKLLEEISHRPELTKELRFFLYFKSHITELQFLDFSIFVKKVLGVSSFSLYYYFLLPTKLWFERLDLMFFPNYMLPILFHGKSLVTLTEDIHFEIHSGTLPWKYKLAYKIFANWAAKHANKIVAVSETSKMEVARLFNIPLTKIVVHQSGIDIPKTLSHGPMIDNYILYVGQAFPRRHLQEIMLAFELISSRFPDLKLIAIGKDKYNPNILESLKNKINERIGYNAIIYKEYVAEDELAGLYSGAKLLIYPSSKEAFGLPPLEALSYGVPPVITDNPISHEIFDNNGFFVANPENPRSIADSIAEGLTNNAKRQEIKNNSKYILQKYTWQKHTDKFLEIIKATQRMAI